METINPMKTTNPLAYKLIMCTETETLFRRATFLSIPKGFVEVKYLWNKPVYDKKGLLIPKYGALRRYFKSKEEHKKWLGVNECNQ